jgi:uncharacterized protein DUF6843
VAKVDLEVGRKERLRMSFTAKNCITRYAATCVAITLLLLGCGERIAEPEIHLIADGYMGDVFIIHDVPGGEPLEREWLSRVYRISRNGILRSQSSMNSGWGMPRYYYISENGDRRQIKEYWPSSIHDTPENRADQSIVIFYARTGEMHSSDIPCAVKYEQYYVGTKSYLLSRKGNEDEDKFSREVQEKPPCPKANDG